MVRQKLPSHHDCERTERCAPAQSTRVSILGAMNARQVRLVDFNERSFLRPYVFFGRCETVHPHDIELRMAQSTTAIVQDTQDNPYDAS